MCKIKLLALDLDGTLTNNKKEISTKNKMNIRLAQERGVQIVLASGRPFIGIKHVADELDLWNSRGFILAYNGGHIIDCQTRNDIVKCTIPMDYVHDICDVINRYKVYPLCYNDIGVISENDSDQYVKREGFNNNIPVIKVDSLERQIKEPVVKFMVVGNPDELILASRYLESIFKGKLNIFFSEPYFLEITPLGIEKASSLAKLSNYLGFHSDNVMACGDGLNDIPMLEYAGLSIAMENAYEETKKVADYISPSNENDGVAVAIRKFILEDQ